MGNCISSTSRSNSRAELSDANTNIYRVVNIDDNGIPLWNGQLGISRTEITLYRKGLSPTRWPLRCLRRYGYDTDLFSFEVGRRCVTGEGIYAFRCRRAESLFQTLQSYIQMSSVGDDGTGTITNSIALRTEASSPMSTLSGQHSTPNNNTIGTYILPNPRSSNANTLRLSPSVTSDEPIRNSFDASESNYLEPFISANTAQLARLQSIGDGTISTISIEPLSPGSPNSINNILEVTQLNPLPNNVSTNNNGVSNIYQEFQLRSGCIGKENTIHRDNCTKKLSLDIPPQEYAPTIHSATSTDALSSRCMPVTMSNGNRTKSIEQLPYSLPMSPTQSLNDCIDTPTYVNVTPGELSSAASTPKVVSMRNNNYLIDSMHCYENLEPNEVRPILLRNQQQQQQQQRRLSRTDLLSKTDNLIATSPTNTVNEKYSEPSTPNHGKVNYIILDLDQNHSHATAASTPNTTTPSTSTDMPSTTNSNSASPVKNVNPINAMGSQHMISTSISTSTTTHSVSSLLLPPESPQKGAFDYVTIDFHKTNALSNSIATTTECEGLRKTRHSATCTDCWPPT